MAYYKLEKDCGLIYAEDAASRTKKKSDIGTDCPFILEIKGGKKQEYPLSDEAAFILRFLCQGLDDALVSQIFASQYGVSAAQAQSDVQNVINKLGPKGYNILKPANPNKFSYMGATVGAPKNSTGIKLHFNVNGWGDWIGIHPF